ncbi:MAG: hypothetical protein U0234_16485 [Sandaracinus sp.]
MASESTSKPVTAVTVDGLRDETAVARAPHARDERHGDGSAEGALSPLKPSGADNWKE